MQQEKKHFKDDIVMKIFSGEKIEQVMDFAVEKCNGNALMAQEIINNIVKAWKSSQSIVAKDIENVTIIKRNMVAFKRKNGEISLYRLN